MKNTVVFYLLLWIASIILLVPSAFAQTQFNNWYFGTQTGITFNATPPSLLTGALNTQEGSAGISDADGKIIFYTDGVTVYNRLHLEMPNGTDLFGHTSSTHSAMIIPHPSASHLFYIFTTDHSRGGRGLNYSIVDMRLDNGNGDVITKNQLLLDRSAERLAAIGACEGGAYWIIARKSYSNEFYVWYLGASGLDKNPIVSAVGVRDGFDDRSLIGWLMPNPSGDMLAMSHYESKEGSIDQLFRFDKLTGVVSDPITLPSDDETYGVAFSQDGSRVYFGGTKFITKYDVTNYDSETILATKSSLTHGRFSHTTLKLGPDGIIYVRARQWIDKIVNANTDGFGYVKDVFFLPAGSEHGIGLPADPVITSFTCPPPIAIFRVSDDSICEANCISYFDSSRFDPTLWEWTFEGGSPATSTERNPQKVCYAKPGTYQARLVVGNQYGSDTTFRSVSVASCPRPVVTLQDTTICISECIRFSDTSKLSKTWKWEFTQGTPSTWAGRNTQPICYLVKGKHKVTLIASNENGSDTATCFVTVEDCTIPIARSKHDTIVCTGGSLDLTDRSGGKVNSWSWSFEGGVPANSVDQHPKGIRYDVNGRYRVRLIVANDAGRDTVDSWVTVRECKPPKAILTDHHICQGDSILIVDISTSDPDSWEWSFDGGTPSASTKKDPGMIFYDQAGTYTTRLKVMNAYGEDSSTATVYVESSSGRISTSALLVTEALTTCSSWDTVVYVSAGCKDLDFSVVSASSPEISVTPSLAKIPAKDSILVQITIKPAIANGLSNEVIDLKIGDESHTIPLVYTVVRSGGLTSSLSSINFGETNICEERDSLVQLTNNGCDTLTLTSADVDKNFNVGGTFPIVLAPGESIDVPITTIVDTVGKPTVLKGNLTITSTADNQLAPITLTRGLSYPTKLRIEAVDEANGKQGDVVKFRIILEGDVPATMTALHFDFLHNNDLLSFTDFTGDDLTITKTSGEETQVQSFTLSPVTKAGVLGEVSFKAYLATAEQTTLTFDNITFEAKGMSFAPECIAVVADSGSRFDFIYTCGDKIIRDRLNGTRMIKQITPNPAKDEIRIELNGGGAMEVSVFNALGTEMVKSACERVDVSMLPSGVYYVRVATAGGVETRRIIIAK